MAPRALLLTHFALLLAAAAASAAAGDGCRSGGCALALASFPVAQNQTLTSVAALFNISDYRTLAPYNPQHPNLDFIPAGGLVRIPFRCDCLALQKPPFSAYLAGSFPYTVSPAETYTSIAARFRNLTTPDWLDRANSFPATNIPDTGVTLNVTVNCSCGDRGVSPDYGLFLTAPLRDGQTTLASAAAANGFNSSSAQMDLLEKYNPGMVTATSGLVFIPVKGDHQ